MKTIQEMMNELPETIAGILARLDALEFAFVKLLAERETHGKKSGKSE